MKLTFEFHHVRSRFNFYFLAASLLPLLLVFLAGAAYMRHTLIDIETAKLESIRDLKVREINTWFDERMMDVILLAKDEEIRNLEGPFDRSSQNMDDLQLIARALGLINRNLQNYSVYLNFSIASVRSGKIELSTDKAEEGTSCAERAEYLEVLKNEKLLTSDAHIARTNGRPALGFAAPIFANSDSKRLIGVVFAEMDLAASLFPLLTDHTGLGQTGETLIVNKDRFFINPVRGVTDAPLKFQTNARPSTLAASGQTGNVQSTDYRGVEVLAAHTHIPRLHWGFVSKQDLAEIYAPVTRLLIYGGVFFALLLGGIILASRVLSATVAGPVLELAEVSRRLRGGDLGARSTVHRDDEVGLLAFSFNEMADFMAHRIEVERGVSALNGTIVQTRRIEAFFQDLLGKLIELTGASLGAAYVRSADGMRFELAASLGAAGTLQRKFDPATLEGELGLVLASPRIQWLNAIPEDTRFVFNAVAGQVVPRGIVTVPLLDDGQVMALLSLASLKDFPPETLDTLERAWTTMNAALGNLLSQERTHLLARELAAKNEELQAQSSELQAQTDELKLQTEELRHQAEEMEAQRTLILEADRLKSEFLSNMSHELRTPLNSVLALSQLMLTRGTGRDPEREAEYLRVIERNGRHLLGLINDILDLSKIESGRMDVSYVETDMGEIIARALDTVRPLAEAKELTLETDLGENLRLSTDDGKVHQILVNLVSNAIKFSDRGAIRVSAQISGRQIQVAVTDRGIGIEGKDIPYIFDEFRQVDGTTTRRHEGTGLGLAICQKFARLLGGEILVKSKSGEGSCFTLNLPLGQPQENHLEPRYKKGGNGGNGGRAGNGGGGGARHGAAGAENSAPPAWSNPPVVLIAEDNEIARLQIGSVIADIGCRVLEAAGGAQALEIMEQTPPDLLILDLMMPEVDGFQVLERLRAVPALADMPVLVLTAKELTWRERAWLASGNVQALVQKGSIDREQLGACIRELLGQGVVAAPSDEPAAPPAAVVDSGPRRRLVLVVEDNADNRFTVSEVLDGMELEYVMAEDGRRGVELARQLHPGVILMDIQLPVLSGLDATRLIKSDPALAAIPIIALTAKAMRGDAASFAAAGCDDTLLKPFSPQDLEGVVRKWLR